MLVRNIKYILITKLIIHMRTKRQDNPIKFDYFMIHTCDVTINIC
jgi:hypothetical protein